MDKIINGDIKKALVSLAIEKALLEISNATLEKVGNKLYADYKCYFSDCYAHPEYLSIILKDLFGKSYTKIVESIKMQLGEAVLQKPIEEFLIKLSE